MGMLATVINSIAFKEVLIKNGVPSIAYSLLDIPRVLSVYNVYNVNERINDGYVCIFGGGNGLPFCTTDTAATQRAVEIGATKILVAKDGVDGIYSDDPKKNPNAERYSHITYDEVFANRLKVMDTSSLIQAQERNIELLVFNMDRDNAIIDAIEGKIPTTIVTDKK
jgi:uridylate kinase